MNILVIGSGGREHAIIHGLKNSPDAEEIYVTPGNGGINKIAKKIDIDVNDFDAIANFCDENNVELVVVGPEDPLVNGIVDALESKNIKAFGPTAAASKIEGSKQYMKDMADKFGIPTAAYEKFSDSDSAKAYVEGRDMPIVVKTDGLAAGKGVIIAANETEAKSAIDEMFDGRFGDAGKKIVIEDFLKGEEASFFAISDGENVIAFGSAQDHKAVGEGDTGPNTGGMGTYSPAPVVTDKIHEKAMEQIILPFVNGMAEQGTPYKGVIFAGLMIDGEDLKLLEFNVRFGDPEAQVLIPRLKTDLLSIINAACEKNLSKINVELEEKTTLCVVMAANGYPGSYKKGSEIKNLDEAGSDKDVIIFHAGTKAEGDKILANGGRVLGVTAKGSDVIEAQKKAYEAVDKIDWEDGFCRRDIGYRAVDRLKVAS